MNMTFLKLIVLALLTLVSVTSRTSNNANINNAPVIQSQAAEFAKQAAYISALATVCGQNTIVFSNRVLEAIGVLGKDGGDKLFAWMAYRQMTDASHIAQLRQHALEISCPRVVSDYRKLPLMQANYQTAVLPKLAE